MVRGRCMRVSSDILRIRVRVRTRGCCVDHMTFRSCMQRSLRDGAMSHLRLKSAGEPPTNFNCGLCKDILKSPQQTSCCGSHFCRGCLEERVSDGGNNCPECKKTGISYFRDISVEKQIALFPTACTQAGCPWAGEFGNLEAHLNEQCDYVMVKCEFSDVGCTAYLPKADMPTHLKEDCSVHLQLTYNFMMKKVASLQTHLDKGFEKELNSHSQMIKSLQVKVEDLDARVGMHKLLPYKILIPNIDHFIHGRQGEEWKSPEFHTGTQDSEGYRMQLRVVPNSIAYTRNKEKALSARLFIVGDKTCEKLTWPFHAKFTLKIIDPSGAEKSCEVTGRHTWESPDDESSMRFQACISHKDLTKYTKHDNCLHMIVL